MPSLYLIFLAAIVCNSLDAKSEEKLTDETLTYLFGEAEPYRETFAKIQEAVRTDDREGFANLAHYPFTVYRPKEECCGSDVLVTVKGPDEFLARFDEIVPTSVKAIIENQQFDDLIANWRGLGFKHGTLWIVGYCVGPDESDPCSETIIRMKSINVDTPK